MIPPILVTSCNTVTRIKKVVCYRRLVLDGLIITPNTVSTRILTSILGEATSRARCCTTEDQD